jgi:DeoR family fructose operon transcriptional repressor
MKPKDEKVFSEERRIAILKLIRERKKVQVSELVEKLNVSATSIRNDLRDLESSNLILRTHGGAIDRPQARYEIEMTKRMTQSSKEKKAIARAALAQIQDGDTILLDTGTTTRELASLLSQKERLTVVTNDIVIAGVLEAAAGVDVFLMGGMVRKGFQCTIGPAWEGGLANLTVDKGFFGANGFSLEAGATTPDLGQSAAKRDMIRMARKVFLLCDHEKIGCVSFSRFATLDDLDALITDSPDDALRQRLEEAGIEVIQATI